MAQKANISRLVENHIAATPDNETDQDVDKIFAALEAEDDSAFRSERAQQLSEELARLKPRGTATTEGDVLVTLRSDDEVLRFTTNHDRVVVHFLHADFARCAIMDTHLREIAATHTRFDRDAPKFGRVDVKDAEFVVQKLAIRVLPCVIGFQDGVVAGRLTGFEGLCWDGNEKGRSVTQGLEDTILKWRLLERKLLVDVEGHDSENEEDSPEFQPRRKGIQGRKQQIAEDDDDWD